MVGVVVRVVGGDVVVVGGKGEEEGGYDAGDDGG